MHYSKEEKEMWLDDWRQSGKSAWAYAKENGLNSQTFVKWKKTETEAKSCLVEVPALMMPPLPFAHEILIEKGEIKIHIPLGMGCNELRAVMEGLGAAL